MEILPGNSVLQKTLVAFARFNPKCTICSPSRISSFIIVQICSALYLMFLIYRVETIIFVLEHAGCFANDIVKKINCSPGFTAVFLGSRVNHKNQIPSVFLYAIQHKIYKYIYVPIAITFAKLGLSKTKQFCDVCCLL